MFRAVSVLDDITGGGGPGNLGSSVELRYTWMAYGSGLFDRRHSCRDETLLLDRNDCEVTLRLARPPSWPGIWLRGMYAGCVGRALGEGPWSVSVPSEMLAVVGCIRRGSDLRGRPRDKPSSRS